MLFRSEECGYVPGKKIKPDIADRLRRAFMRDNPVLAVLDANHDNEISAAEIANSAAALRKLDRNHDSVLTPAEYIPDKSEIQAGMMLSWLDSNDDGSLSPKEQAVEEALPLRTLLDAADSNRDGVVTRAELTRELAFRAELRRQTEEAQKKRGFPGFPVFRPNANR